MISRKNNTYCKLANSHGFSLFELGVVAVIFAILTAVLLNRIQFYQREAELAKVEQVAGILRIALQFKVSEYFVVNQKEAVEKLADQNPMELLESKPPNYLGEYYAPKLETLQKGNWFYDRNSKMLVYLLNNGKSFGTAQSNLLKFKVKLIRLPTNPAKLDGSPSVIKGVVMDQVFDHDSHE
jgi:type II secretory pathway pseudopilin PulG